MFSEKDVHISYTTARKNVLDALNKIGLNPLVPDVH